MSGAVLMTTSAAREHSSILSKLSRSPMTVCTRGYLAVNRLLFSSSRTRALMVTSGCWSRILSRTAPPMCPVAPMLRRRSESRFPRLGPPQVQGALSLLQEYFGHVEITWRPPLSRPHTEGCVCKKPASRKKKERFTATLADPKRGARLTKTPSRRIDQQDD